MEKGGGGLKEEGYMGKSEKDVTKMTCLTNFIH